MDIRDLQITWSTPPSTFLGHGWSIKDGRPLSKLTASCYIENILCTLTAYIKEGEVGKPLVIGFPGYLSDATGQGIFFDFVDDSYKNYTVVTLSDREGESRTGSWYLGKPLPNNFYSYLFLLPFLVRQIVNKKSPSKTIFYGTSMGGYGALLHSYFCDVDEVYLCVPQTNLCPKSHYFRYDPNNYGKERTPFTESQRLKALNLETPEKYQRATECHPYIDVRTLSDFVTQSNTFSCGLMNGSLPPYFHLVTARYDHQLDDNGSYFSQMILPLVSFLSRHNINFSMVTFPFAAHDAFIYPQSICEFSEKYLASALSDNSNKRSFTAKERLYGESPWRCFLTPDIYRLWY